MDLTNPLQAFVFNVFRKFSVLTVLTVLAVLKVLPVLRGIAKGEWHLVVALEKVQKMKTQPMQMNASLP